jgi:hypothetical protein
MRISKLTLLSLLALVFTTQACSLPAQALTPQVITVVVTAAPTSPDKTAETTATAAPTFDPTSTPPATETPAPSATPAPTATETASPTKAIQAAAPTKTAAPQIPMVSNLPAQGPKGGDIDFEINMSSVYLMRIKARKHGSANDGDGISHVAFIVKKKNNEKVYSNTENTAKYCIFQGGEPDCNPWPKVNGRYVWGSGGPEIVSGDYLVTIRAALKSDPSNESEWNFQITIKLP